MKTNFTKGEWNVGFEDFTSKYEVPYVEVNSGAKLIAKATYGKDTKEREANAKLIAAAPILLENLIRCVDRLEENGFGSMSAVERAKKAIKKATE